MGGRLPTSPVTTLDWRYICDESRAMERARYWALTSRPSEGFAANPYLWGIERDSNSMRLWVKQGGAVARTPGDPTPEASSLRRQAAPAAVFPLPVCLHRSTIEL